MKNRHGLADRPEASFPIPGTTPGNAATILQPPPGINPENHAMETILNFLRYWLFKAPSWNRCRKASCWDGRDAGTRHMNNLSPKLSGNDYRKRVEWALQRGCDTVHYFLANERDGELSGYWAHENAELSRGRIRYARLHGLAVVLWLVADDSRGYASRIFSDPDGYVSKIAKAGLLKDCSIVVLGLEMTEYGDRAQWTALRDALKRHWSGPIGVHHTSGRLDYADLGDIVFDQLEPSAATPAAIAARIAKIRKAGKAANGFEYSRSPDRSKAQAALDAGAAGCGNW